MVREGGEGSYRWLWGCSHRRFPFCTTCTAVLVTDDGDDAECCDAVEDLWLFYASLSVCEWWRTYNCFMPHCNDGVMIVFHHPLLLCGRFNIFPCHVAFTGCCVGSLALSLGSSTSISFAQHDVAQAFRWHTEQCACFFCCPFIHILSFLILYCNHRAATSSLVGLFLGSHTILAELEWGSNFFSNFCLTSSAVEAGLGSCTGLKFLSRMFDLDQWPCCCS